MHVCTGPEDPERLARQAAERGADIVAALGGDGQVGLCANGVIGSGSALAVIPAGTGNDFARHIGLDRKDPLAAARLLSWPTLKKIDVVRVMTADGERYFVNVGGARRVCGAAAEPIATAAAAAATAAECHRIIFSPRRLFCRRIVLTSRPDGGTLRGPP